MTTKSWQRISLTTGNGREGAYSCNFSLVYGGYYLVADWQSMVGVMEYWSIGVLNYLRSSRIYLTNFDIAKRIIDW